MLTNVVAPDKLGGLERYVRELSESLADRGTEVVVVAKASGDGSPGIERVSPRLTIMRYRPPSKRNPLFGALYPIAISTAVRRALQEVGADRAAVRSGEVVIHGHFPVPMLPVVLMRLPFLYTMHAPVYKELLGERQESYRLPVPLQRVAVAGLAALERSIVRRAHCTITLSAFIAAEAWHLARRPIRAARIVGGIDVDWFSPGGRIDHGGSPVLFSARRMVERTGVELLVEAMPDVLRELPEAHLYIAGDGPRRSHVLSLIGRLGLAESVTILGRISDEELLSWYRSADLCVTPTLYLEGFGLSTAEAMACGTPTVVTPAGANEELVTSVHPALLADAVTPTALARAIVASWSASQHEDLSDRSRGAIAPAMGWRSVAEQHQDLYDQLGEGPEGDRGI